VLRRVATLAFVVTVLGAAASTPSSTAGEARKPAPVCGACAGAPPEASVTTAPTFVITGRGWGHGVGMSQWGAYGYARHRWSYARILAHYYVGTQLAPQPTTQIRVLLAQGRAAITISSKVPFRVRDADGNVLKLGAGSIRVGAALEVKAKGAKKAKPLDGPITFLPGATPLTVGHPYRGWIQVSSNGAKVQAVNVVSLEQYLYGVVPEEVPETWPAEALKAQAVAARSYALATRKSGGTFDLYADTRSQVYGGLDAERFSTTAAVDSTAGRVVTYKGRPAVTYFFSTSGGRTASIQDAWPGTKPVPYLVSVPDPYDSFSPHHRWGPLVFSAKPLRKKLHLPAGLLDVRTTVNASSRVTSLVAVSPLGELAVPGTLVRQLLGLQSTWFRVGVMILSRPLGAVTYGSGVRLSGLARGISAASLEERVGDAAWEAIAKLSAARDGSFATLVSPHVTTTYRIAGAVATSEALRVPVAPSVRLLPAATATELRGTVRPILPNAIVQIQRQNGAAWSTVATARVDPTGAYRAALRLTTGTYRALVSPGRGLVTGLSAPLRVVAQ
jgi:stage II sporulation protein D